MNLRPRSTEKASSTLTRLLKFCLCSEPWGKTILFSLSVTMLNGAFAIPTAPGVSTDANTFLGPTIHAHISQPIGYNISSSFGVEGGPRQYRGNATLGWILAENHRIKFTGEYLWQKINYNFYSGIAQQWVNQGAVGAGYQYMLLDGVINDLRLYGYYSHAPSIGLSTFSGSFVNSNTTYTYIDQRRIAGSNAAGFSPGFALHPWYGAQAVISANYDNVRYNTKYISTRHYSGFGGTLDFKQALPGNLQMNLLAASRTAFNNYQAGLNWNKTVESGLLTLGIIGGYNKGKHTLPNTSVISFNVGYAFDQSMAIDDNDRDYKLASPLSTWVAEPAVRMPQVLAIADERVTLTSFTPASCVPPSFTGTIGNIVGGGGNPITPPFETASHFGGTNLVFSATNLPTAYVNIDSGTGIISGFYASASNVIVTATNSCGSASSNPFNIQAV